MLLWTPPQHTVARPSALSYSRHYYYSVCAAQGTPCIWEWWLNGNCCIIQSVLRFVKLKESFFFYIFFYSLYFLPDLTIETWDFTNRSSHLGIHKQTNTCWSIPISQTVFIHFKICRRSAKGGNYEAFLVVYCYQLQLI